MSEPSIEQKAIGSLLRRLDVRPGEQPDEFIAEPARQPGSRLFGGLVAGQAVVAAARTVSGLSPHSLHAYFLEPGDPSQRIRYRVERLKEGRNFHARSVIGYQPVPPASEQDGSPASARGERVIFSLQASFTRPESGFAHHDPMPEAPPPEELPEASFGFWDASSPVKLRDCDGSFDRAAEQGMRRLWVRPSAPPPEDPVLHLGLLTFATDMTLMMTGLLPHAELRSKMRRGASLDHAVWFHQPPTFDDWLLYTMQTPAAHGGRPLITGALYRRDGTRVLSVAQEGLIRIR